MIQFCFDSMGEHGLGYPNLALPGLAPAEFDQTWPFTIPFRVQMYLDQAQIDYQVHHIDSAPPGAWYPVALGWHNFECDYFSLLSPLVQQRIRQRDIKILFYYHEGDNPVRIKTRFDQLCQQHQLPNNCYLFVSANSSAAQLENFYYFSDHESFFRYINRHQQPPTITDSSRDYKFTAINRSHKWWRAACMSQLKQQGVLDGSLWSYNTQCLVGDQPEDNPVSLDYNHQLIMSQFVNQGPYFCDSDNSDAHNDHRYVTEHLYTHSYCHIVLETLFDADQSNGAFVTEKTYKCFKFGQPFVMVGPAHSLDSLRNSGYRVFDHVIDNTYDSIEDNNQRWSAIQRTIHQIQTHTNLHQWYTDCLSDLIHNQTVFMQSSSVSVNKLAAKLAANFDAV